MRIAFLMDPLESIDPVHATTSHLMYECNQRGHTVYFFEPHDLYLRKNTIVARMRDVTVPPDQSMKKYWRALMRCLRQDDRIYESATGLDALFLRKNPPLVHRSLEFLAPVNEHVFIINSAKGQLLANSKLYTLNFPDLIPETHISRDPARLRRVIDDFGGAMIVKPLERYGGEGVVKVNADDPENLNSLIHYYVAAYKAYPSRDPIMVQEYLDEVKDQGEVRTLLLNGEIIGATRKDSRSGDSPANVHRGAKTHAHQVTSQERRVCEALRERLIGDGLHFVGIDLIGGKLVGIDCISPGGIPHMNRLNRVKRETKVVDFVEQKVQGREGVCSERSVPSTRSRAGGELNVRHGSPAHGP
jgi:glutathione synthase